MGDNNGQNYESNLPKFNVDHKVLVHIWHFYILHCYCRWEVSIGKPHIKILLNVCPTSNKSPSTKSEFLCVFSSFYNHPIIP